jgi:hypothetical protein
MTFTKVTPTTMRIPDLKMGRVYLELIAKKGGFRPIIATAECVVFSDLSAELRFDSRPAKLITSFAVQNSLRGHDGSIEVVKGV